MQPLTVVQVMTPSPMQVVLLLWLLLVQLPYHMVVAGVESGDKIKLSSTALSVATTVNWIGASGQIRVITALNGSALGVTGTFGESATIEGSVAVFVTGGDTYSC